MQRSAHPRSKLLTAMVCATILAVATSALAKDGETRSCETKFGGQVVCGDLVIGIIHQLGPQQGFGGGPIGPNQSKQSFEVATSSRKGPPRLFEMVGGQNDDSVDSVPVDLAHAARDEIGHQQMMRHGYATELAGRPRRCLRIRDSLAKYV